MRKAYKKILSTAMVLSIVIQGNTVFAKEVSTSQDKESKKLVFVYEKKRAPVSGSHLRRRTAHCHS